MVQALPKGKVVYQVPNLSALAISNFAKAIKSDVQVTKAPKPDAGRHEFYSVELRVDGKKSICGELSIMDFIATQKNRTNKSRNMHMFLQGQASTLAFDDWASVLNRRLRPAMDSHTVNKPECGAGPEVKETIKAVAKALEDQKMLDTLTADAESTKRYAYLSALVYSYLESASKLLNKRV